MLQISKTSFLLIILGILLHGLISGQLSTDQSYSSNLNKEFLRIWDEASSKDSLLLWKEQLYLHLDRSSFYKGEQLWFKAYVVLGRKLTRKSPSTALTLELLDSQNDEVSSQIHQIDNGVAQGSFKFPNNIKPGDYVLRAYTNWMLNYGEEIIFRKRIRIVDPTEELAKDFTPGSTDVFPEGGYLLADKESMLVLRREYNLAGNVSGTIIDDSGEIIKPISWFRNGVGMVSFKPQSGKSYAINFKDGHSIPLEIKEKGCLLRVNNMDQNSALIEIQASEGMQDELYVLSGTIGGRTFFKEEIDLLGRSSSIMEIDKSDFPGGIMHLVLTDRENNLMSWRPVLIDGQDIVRLEVEQEQQGFEREQEVVLKVKTTDGYGNPVSTDLSLSITDADQYLKDRLESDIVGQLNMGTQTSARNYTASQGSINDRRLRFLADLDVLSNPSNRIDLNLKYDPESTVIRYPFQIGLKLSGYAYDLNNRLLKNTDLLMFGEAGALRTVREIRTDSLGRISLEDLDAVGETKYSFRTVGDSKRSKVVKMVKDKNAVATVRKAKSNVFKDITKGPRKISTSLPDPLNAEDPSRLIALDEAVVNSNRIPRKSVPTVYGVEPTFTVFQDLDRPKTLLQLIMQMPGVQVFGAGDLDPIIYLNRSNNSLRGAAKPLWVVDGSVIGNYFNNSGAATGVSPNAAGGGADNSLLGTANVRQREDSYYYSPAGLLTSRSIERVELLMGPAAAIYGSRAAAGVFVVYTRDGSEFRKKSKEELVHFSFKGFEPPSDFSNELADNGSSDQPATLYWSPNVITDQNGEATIRFKCPANYNRVQVVAETVTPDGRTGSLVRIFE